MCLAIALTFCNFVVQAVEVWRISQILRQRQQLKERKILPQTVNPPHDYL